MSQGASANAHAVIDGSNLATEGRSEPSLAQLDEAVRAIDAEFDFAQITVIVDATFEHRVAKSETKAARAAIDDGDIITPPAGVIGRGDAFILEVADRADAVVFSNDSFQEFHGTYDWLFDEGRLVGGKPIPGVGWIYVARSPVRGPVSRRATAESRRAEKATKKATKTARKATKKAATSGRGSAKDDGSDPGRRGRKSSDKGSADKGSKDQGSKDQGSKDRASKDQASRDRSSSRSRRQSSASASEGRNDPALWSTFRDDFPVGSTIAARVERFSSHGAYGSVDEVVVYLPNRLLGDPPPTKARDVLDVGTTMDFVVHRYDEERKGIDAGLIPVDGADGDDRNNQQRTKESNVAKKAAKKATKKRPAKKTAAKKTAAKKAAAKKAPAKKTAAKKTATKRTTAKKTAKKAPAKKTAAKKTAAKKTAAKKTATKKTTAKKAARKTTKRR